MVLFDRRLRRTIMVGWLVLTTTHAPVRADGVADPYFDGPITLERFHEVVRKAHRGKDCRPETCRALIDVGYAFAVLMQRAGGTNAMAMLDRHPPEPDPRYAAEARVRRLIRAGPRRWAKQCGVLVDLARGYREWIMGLNTIETARWITAPRRDCLRSVITALPRNDETSRLIQAAKADCFDRKEEFCAKIDLDAYAKKPRFLHAPESSHFR